MVLYTLIFKLFDRKQRQKILHRMTSHFILQCQNGDG